MVLKHGPDILKKEQNKTILFGLVSGLYIIIASFNPPFYPQVFYGLLCTLFGINYLITGITFTLRAKSFKIYKGVWVKMCGLVLTLLGLWLIFTKPNLPF